MLREFFQNLRPLMKRYLFSAVCVGLCLLLLIGATILWLDQRQLSLRAQLRTAQGEAVLAALAAGPALRESLAQVRATTARIQENLMAEPNLADNLWYFYNFETTNRVRLSNLQQLFTAGGDPASGYKLIPYSLRVTGTFPQVMGFLQALETGPKLAQIRAFSLDRIDPAGEQIAMQLEVSILGRP